jgi:hypothetical protein
VVVRCGVQALTDKKDDVRQYNIKRRIAKEGQKAYNKYPKIQRLVTITPLCCVLRLTACRSITHCWFGCLVLPPIHMDVTR